MGGGGSGPLLEFANLNIADITGHEKKPPSNFSYLCTSTVKRQGWTPLEKILDPRLKSAYLASCSEED